MELKMDVDLQSLSDKELIELISDCSKEIGTRLVKSLNVVEPEPKPEVKSKVEPVKKVKNTEPIIKKGKEELIDWLKAHPKCSASEAQEQLKKEGKDYSYSVIWYEMSKLKNAKPDTPKKPKLWKPNPLATPAKPLL